MCAEPIFTQPTSLITSSSKVETLQNTAQKIVSQINLFKKKRQILNQKGSGIFIPILASLAASLLSKVLGS
jgi:hypothetical protein